MFTGDYADKNGPISRIRLFLRRLVISDRRQFITVGVVFVVVFLLSRDGRLLAALVRISEDRMVGFLSTVSQAIAALLGLLIAALLFTFGGIKQSKDAAYGTLKAEMMNLIRLWQDRPESLKPLDESVEMFIESFAYLRREKLHKIQLLGPQKGKASWNEASDALYEAMVDNDIRSVNLSRDDDLYLSRFLATLNNVEEAYSAMGFQLISGVVTRSNLKLVYKLSGLLSVSLLLLVVFSLEDVGGIFPDLGLPVLFALITWVLLSLMELANEVAELRDGVEKS